MRKAKRARSSNLYRDTHHILWPRHDWNKGWAKTLREYWYLKIEIPMKTLHRQIHHEMLRVPVPKVSNIKAALFQLSQLEKYEAIHKHDNIEHRLTVLMALFECCEPETYNALKQQLEIVRKFYKKTPR